MNNCSLFRKYLWFGSIFIMVMLLACSISIVSPTTTTPTPTPTEPWVWVIFGVLCGFLALHVIGLILHYKFVTIPEYFELD